MNLKNIRGIYRIDPLDRTDEIELNLDGTGLWFPTESYYDREGIYWEQTENGYIKIVNAGDKDNPNPRFTIILKIGDNILISENSNEIWKKFQY